MANNKLLKFLILSLFLVFPLGQLERLPIQTVGVNIYLHDLIISGFILVFAYHYRKKTHLIRVEKSVFPFILIASASFLINIFRWGAADSLLGFLYLARWIVYFLFYLFLSNLLDKNDWKKHLKKSIIYSITISIIIGFAQYFLYPDLRFLKYFDWDPHYFRLTGAWLDSGFSGMIYLLFFIYLFQLFSGSFLKIKKILLLVGSYLAMALTYSRSSFLAFLTVGLIYSLKLKKVKYFVATMILLLSTAWLLPRKSTVSTQLERKDSVYARIENWQDSLKVSFRSPILGVGFNNYQVAQEKLIDKNISPTSHSASGADSSLFFILATTGIIGLSAYLFHIYNSVSRSKNSLLLLASTGALLVHSIFNNSLFYSWIMIWWWIIIALEEKN
jgi:hypothetical protein